MRGEKLTCRTALLVAALCVWATTSACAEDAAPAASSEATSVGPFSRIELYSKYIGGDRELNFNAMTPLGFARVRAESELSEYTFGVRLFLPDIPLPVVDMSYRGTRDDTDTTIWAPGPVLIPSLDHDHEFKFGGMALIPKVGLFKVAAYDTETTSAYGLYLVPKIYGTVLKFGYEWSNVSGADDDGLGFLFWTVPYEDWRFSVGYSDNTRGYKMGGLQAGRWFDRWFVAGGGYVVESDRPAWGVMAGRAGDPAQGDLSFWAVHQNGPTFKRTNINIAWGSPGIPKEALTNDMANGIYTSLFTDQMGQVVPIPVRNFEEMRIWVRPDEYAQPAAGHGGVSVYFDWLNVAVGYEMMQGSVFYTHPRVGPVILPHVGPVFEKERFPGVGWTDSRFGMEVGGYLLERPAGKFYRAGRVYMGVRGVSDFDDTWSLMGELRLNL